MTKIIQLEENKEINTPIGKIIFSSLNKPHVSKNHPGSTAKYKIKFAFEKEDKIAEELFDQLLASGSRVCSEEINLETGKKTGRRIISLSNTSKPAVYDADDNEVETIPMIDKGTEARARFLIRRTRYNTTVCYLKAVQIVNLVEFKPSYSKESMGKVEGTFKANIDMLKVDLNQE